MGLRCIYVCVAHKLLFRKKKLTYHNKLYLKHEIYVKTQYLVSSGLEKLIFS